MAYTGGDDAKRDNPDNGFRGMMRGLRDFVTQIADPTAPQRPQAVNSPGRRPPRGGPRTVTASSTGAREPIVDIFDEGDVHSRRCRHARCRPGDPEGARCRRPTRHRRGRASAALRAGHHPADAGHPGRCRAADVHQWDHGNPAARQPPKRAGSSSPTAPRRRQRSNASESHHTEWPLTPT